MKILIIGTQLPPYNGSSNIRWTYYINYLSRLGHDIFVLTIDYPKDAIAYDFTLENVFEKDIKVFRCSPGKYYKYFYKKKYNSNKNKEKKILRNYLNKTIKKFIIPDAYIFWQKEAKKIGLQIVKDYKIEYVLSIHETPSSHMVAYYIKKNIPHITWIGYWSDPWIGDNIRNSNDIKIKKFIEKIIEKKIIKLQDKLWFTSINTLEMYKSRYNIDLKKMSIVYRGYDKKLYEKFAREDNIPNEIKKDKINVLYTGVIYKNLRDISQLYKALLRLKINNVDIYNKFNIIFIGSFDSEEDKNLLKEIDIVKIINTIPYKEVVKYIVNSEFLILFGNKNSTQIPGKLYEYAGAKSAILTILGDENDPCFEIMKKINKGPIINNKEDEIYKVFIKIGNINNEELIKWKTPYENFEWENIVKDLENKIFN